MPDRDYYREKLLQEIEVTPREMAPILYRIVHLLNTQWNASLESKKGKRGSLKGIWKGAIIDESLFAEARRSLFNYEGK
jgi:hypothetical protein